MVSIVIPTYNERDNIVRLIEEIELALQESGILDYEILVMDDDSPDRTCELVRGLGKAKVRCLNRRGKEKGLSHSVLDGFKQAKGEYIGVLDADLSHSPKLIPKLVQALKDGANLAVGSRYVPGGGVQNWPLKRRLASRFACVLARPLTRVKDATSGFFFFRKSVIDGVSLSALGFKIGLEVFVRGRHQNKVKEVPYVFVDRQFGQSKLGTKVMKEYLIQLMRLAFRC